MSAIIKSKLVLSPVRISPLRIKLCTQDQHPLLILNPIQCRDGLMRITHRTQSTQNPLNPIRISWCGLHSEKENRTY